MDMKSIIIVVLVALIIGCAAGIAVNEVIEPEAKAYTGQSWELMCTNLVWPDDFNGMPVRADIGTAGWEMTALTISPKEAKSWGEAMGVLACFRRPKIASN